jgi:hypothetical protein
MINKKILIFVLSYIINFSTNFGKFPKISNNLSSDLISLKKFSNTYTMSVNDFEKIKKNTKTMYICTHDYDFKDIVGTYIFLSNCKNKNFSYVVANAWWNYIWKLKKNKDINLFYKPGGKNKLISELRNNNNVILFIYRFNNYHGFIDVIKETNCNVVLININCMSKNNDIKTRSDDRNPFLFLKSINNKYHLSLLDFNEKINDTYEKKIKEALYNKTNFLIPNKID